MYGLFREVRLDAAGACFPNEFALREADLLSKVPERSHTVTVQLQRPFNLVLAQTQPENPLERQRLVGDALQP